MTAKELAAACGFDTVILSNPNAEITVPYCCDLLSIVMGRAPAGCGWVTVMGNMNSVAVASLAEIGAVILADGIKPDDNALKKAEENGINIFLSPDSVFDTALKVYKALN